MYHLLLLLQRPHQQQQHMLLQHLVLVQHTLLQHPLSSKDNSSSSSDIFAAASHTTSAAAVLSPGWTLTHMKVNVATSGQNMSLVWAYCTGGSVCGTNQGKNVMMPASPRRQGVSSVHPQRYQGLHPTFAQGIILYYTPEAICQKCIVRTQLFLADNDPDTPQKLVIVAVVHHISWGTARTGPSKHVGGLMGAVDVVVRSSSSNTPHLMGSGPGRPVKHRKHMGRLMGRAERPI